MSEDKLFNLQAQAFQSTKQSFQPQLKSANSQPNYPSKQFKSNGRKNQKGQNNQGEFIPRGKMRNDSGKMQLEEALGMSEKNAKQLDVNSLLGFQYKDEADDYQKYNQRSKTNRKRGNSFNPLFNKEQYMQASFKFVIRPPKSKDYDDYLRYLVNPEQIVDWKDIVEAIYTPPSVQSPQKIVCPICLESSNAMVAPRVTKCGHIFCWPCLLQYLQFEKQHAWKKCPLCADPIYKTDIKRTRLIVQDEGELTLRLMVRNKANISLMVADHKETKIMGSRLPHVSASIYSQSRIRVADDLYMAALLIEDIELLRSNLAFRQSCGEKEIQPFLSEAISHCESQLTKLQSPVTAVDSDEEQKFVPLAELNNRITLKKTHSEKKDDLEINRETCFYFYQASNGDAVFLHPLCLQMLESENNTLPLELKSLQVLEVEIAQQVPDFLGHLPPATVVTLIQVSMYGLVHDKTLKQYSYQLQKREKARKTKAQKEERYTTKVDKFVDKKFDELKKQSFGFVTENERRSEPVIKYLAKVVEQLKAEPEEEKKEEPVVEIGFTGLAEPVKEQTHQGSVWDQFGKNGGDERLDLQIFAQQNTNIKKVQSEPIGESLSNCVIIQSSKGPGKKKWKKV